MMATKDEKKESKIITTNLVYAEDFLALRDYILMVRKNCIHTHDIIL
jgi:hypothetical protein